MNQKNPFFEGWSWFKLNNLRMAVGTDLKFYTSEVSKVWKFLGLIGTFADVRKEKLVGGPFRPPILNRGNFKSFTSFSCQISLIKCLVNRSFKIYNNWNTFYNDIESIKSNLIKNRYPPFLSLKNASNIRFLVTKTN